MRSQRLVLVAGNDVEVQMKHGLTRSWVVELGDTYAVRVERPLDTARDDLCGLDQLCERVGVDIEKIARLRLRDHERVPVRRGHGIHEGKHFIGLVNFGGGQLAAQNPREYVVGVVHRWYRCVQSSTRMGSIGLCAMYPR